MEPVNLPCAAPLGVGLAQAPLKCGEKSHGEEGQKCRERNSDVWN